MRNIPIEIEPIAGALGAEIHGVDVAAELPDATIADIRRALLAHGVILFRDQRLDVQGQKRFARRVGEIFIHLTVRSSPAASAGAPDRSPSGTIAAPSISRCTMPGRIAA
jgi:alpha-ketoglutarate-dependent taurine dioxygenase